jgi:hypothetical protein
MTPLQSHKCFDLQINGPRSVVIGRLSSAPGLQPSGLWGSDGVKTPEAKTPRVRSVLRHSMMCRDPEWLSRVTQNCDFQWPEMPNQLDTCRCLIVPRVIVFHLSFLTWSATFTSWICRPRSLHDHIDFGILDVNVLHFQVPVCETLKWSQINFSAFRTSQLRDSCDEESRHLTPPSPGIRNSEMELDQRSRSNFDLTAKVIL